MTFVTSQAGLPDKHSTAFKMSKAGDQHSAYEPVRAGLDLDHCTIGGAGSSEAHVCLIWAHNSGSLSQEMGEMADNDGVHILS